MKRFKIEEFKNASGSISYRISGTKVDGSRVRQNYLTENEAQQQRLDLEEEASGYSPAAPVKRTRLTNEQLSDAEAAIQVTNDRKLAEIVSHYLGIEKRLRGKGIEVESAVSFAESHYRSELESISILNAHAKFLESRVDKELRTKKYYETSLRHLLVPDPNKLLHKFSVTDIEKILVGYKNLNTKRAYRRAFSVFFNWAIRHHYCLEDPCKRLDRLPKDSTQIAVLSYDEVRRLLVASMRHSQGAAAASVAIGLFAGLRPSEIAALKPEDIGKEKIKVSGGKLKRLLNRTVPIPPVLAVWLEKYPFSGLPAGWDYKLKVLKNATRASKWVQDIIRHTSITFQTERDKNEALTAYNCGTSIKMMNLHYRSSIEEEKTIASFWCLMPDKLLADGLGVELPGKSKVEWPDKSTLKKLVWQKPLIHVASDIGVSDVALKKHCVRLDIKLPPMGFWLRGR